jgi:ribosomal protein S18 acetylase RimI-like enzyme
LEASSKGKGCEESHHNFNVGADDLNMKFLSTSGQGKSRRLTIGDLDHALQLCREARWNQTKDDWRILLELAPDGCLAIEVDGNLAATTTILCHGSRLAWVGMVLTKKEFQERGFARRLLSEVLTLAEKKKIDTVKLDATDQGKRLYEKAGFRAEQPVERWLRAGVDSEIPATNVATGEWHRSDREVFGADRSGLLKKLGERNAVWTSGDSFLLGRSGAETGYLGPCVSDDPHSARLLIERFVQSTKSAISWDLLPQNQNAVAIAKDLGFVPQRRLTRMVRGKDLRGKEKSVYALAGFEFG